MPVARDLWWGTDAGVARGGGARGWQFLRRNPEFHEVWEACARERPVYEDAPFPIRRQSDAERGIGRFGLFGVEDPFAVDGPASPFWSVAAMLEVEPVSGEGRGLAAAARAAGTALAGLRLADGALILKLERGGRALQLRIAAGEAFHPVRDSVKTTLSLVTAGWPKRYARAGDLWRLVHPRVPPEGRGTGTGTGIASFSLRLTASWPGCRIPGSPWPSGARRQSPGRGGSRTARSARGCAGASSAPCGS